MHNKNTMVDFQLRRNRLRELLKEQDCTAMLVTNASNVRYLTGFSGHDSYLLVSRDDEVLISDPRYEQQIGEQCQGLATWIRQPGEMTWDVVGVQLNLRHLSDLVIESSSLPVAIYDKLMEKARIGKIEKGKVQVEQLREIKDADEIALIRRAIDLAQRVFSSLRATIAVDQTEIEVANEIHRLTRLLGGDDCSFKPIVAVGPRAALPHAEPGATRIGASSFVLIDWGAIYQGYCSDLTRVLMNSTILPKFSDIYQAVLSAQRAAIDAIKPGVSCGEVDAVARSVFTASGLDSYFTHGLGHGIGLDIHEAPRLGKNQDRKLEAGMVVTVEPGLYFPQFGGVRIEDDVLVTPNGCELLSSLPADLESNQVEFLS